MLFNSAIIEMAIKFANCYNAYSVKQEIKVCFFFGGK